jgi:Ca2+-binding EF-hand superfamily protein
MAYRLHRALAAGFVLIAGAGTAFAQSADSPPPEQGMEAHHDMGMRHHDMHWDEMDTNHDGKISAAEHAAWAKAQFQKLDADHDGFITKEEMHTQMKARMDAMMKEHRAKMFDRIDTNHDGMISRDEMDAAMQKMHGMHGHMHGDRMKGDGMHDDDMDDMQPPPPPPTK